MIKLLKNQALPIAMLAGGLGYHYFSMLGFLTPWMIAAMLFLTFSKLSMRELRIERMHLWLLLIEIPGSIAVYYLLRPIDPVVAQGAMICIMAPTATAAPVITGKLGGSIGSLTSYTLLSNVAVAVVAPLFFPLVANTNHPDFLQGFVLIITKVFPLLLGPFILAQAVRNLLPKLHRQVEKAYGAGFYIWAVSLSIVTGQTVRSLVEDTQNLHIAAWAATLALVSCIVLFYAGKRIGKHYGQVISGGQALGQKNTILAIWMAHTYLNPLSAIAPGTYVLWQNLFNSWQLWRKNRREQTASADGHKMP